MPESFEIHQEGPAPESADAEVRVMMEFGKTDEMERLAEFELLKEQIDSGQYDGDGPSDVSPTDQMA